MRRERQAIRTESLGSGEVTRQASARLTIETGGPGFVELTEAVAAVVRDSGIGQGVATISCRHTSASLLIGENADPDVRRDLLAAFDRLAPRNAGYVHDTVGPDDMPAHIRSVLTGASLAIPILSGRLALGTWQGIFLVEHRDAPHRREVLVNLNGG